MNPATTPALPILTELPALSWPVFTGLGFAALLFGFAVVLVVTVLRKSPRPIPAVQRVKSGFGTLLWVVPAIAIVTLIGSRARPVFESPRPPAPEPPRPVETVLVTNRAEPPAGALAGAAARFDATALPQRGSLTLRGEVNEAPTWSASEEIAVEQNPDVDPVHPVFRSKRYAAREQAVDEVTKSAVRFLERKYQTELNSRVKIDPSLVDRLAVSELVVERYIKEFPLSEGDPVLNEMFIAHLRLNLGDPLRDAVYAQSRAQTVNQRLQVLGGGLALVTLLLGTVSTYLRLDDATGGKYRTRLKFAAAAVLAAAGMTAMVIA